MSKHVKLDSSVNLGRGGGGGWKDCQGSQEDLLRGNVQLITAIIFPVFARDKGLLARPLIIKHKVVCLLMLEEEVKIKAKGLL